VNAGGPFRDRVAWITGASAGIGRELALVLAEQGARVAVSARRVERLEALVAAIADRGGEALAVECDVADEARVAGAVEEVVRRFGRLDVAIANAGFGVPGRLETLSAADWRRQLDVNVIGLAETARYALPHLRRTRGRLVLVGSVAGWLPGPGAVAYVASKAAVGAIGRTLAVELHGSGVSCTTVYPGFVESEIGRVGRDGVFRPDADDRRPGWLLWPTRRAALVMARGIHRRRRELVFTGHGRIGAFVGRHWPGLVHAALTLRRRSG
jgi:NAD(P)-dependent dehydrogenase (short-subunit alcohol dehydrogenase family)